MKKSNPRGLAPLKAKYRDKARESYAGDDLQIDRDARVALAEDGAWIQSWVWVDVSSLEGV